jgi:NADH:quinone reductase (non-electrogenic)
MCKRPRVVIIGGGFGGLYATRALRSARVDVILVDQRNFHLFQPLLYQVATASLSPGDIATPLRGVLRHQKNARVWLAEAVSIDTAAKRVGFRDGSSVSYTFLIVATGATHAYFGHPDWEPLAPGLKTIEDALEMRRRFLNAFEAAERARDSEERARLTTFVIVGGGPTGVELAGAMAEIARLSLPREFRDIDTSCARVLLLEGGPRVLPAFPPELSEKARTQLEELGVEVQVNTYVTQIGPHIVQAGNETIPAANVFWAAGVEASPLGHQLGSKLDRAGRVFVEPDCSIPGHPEVFVIGDLAHALSNGKPVPGVAQGAMQMGRHVARSIRGDLAGKARVPFHYIDKGSLATIGRARAVADTFGLKLSGLVAWVTWAFVHILYLIGFENRLLVMLQWAAAYFTRRRGVRLITEPWRPRAEKRSASPADRPAEHAAEPASANAPPAGGSFETEPDPRPEPNEAGT